MINMHEHARGCQQEFMLWANSNIPLLIPLTAPVAPVQVLCCREVVSSLPTGSEVCLGCIENTWDRHCLLEFDCEPLCVRWYQGLCSIMIGSGTGGSARWTRGARRNNRHTRRGERDYRHTGGGRKHLEIIWVRLWEKDQDIPHQCWPSTSWSHQESVWDSHHLWNPWCLLLLHLHTSVALLCISSGWLPQVWRQWWHHQCPAR